MTYLTKEFCKEIQKKCIATSCKLLIEINDLKIQDEHKDIDKKQNVDKIENIKKKLVEINNIIEAINNYMLFTN
jgi:hypothetical protein